MSWFARRQQQVPEALAVPGIEAQLALGEQQPPADFASSVSEPNSGIESSVWNASQAMPCGSVTQCLSDFT
jgi:hypothetical protein